jgi:WD40 repeat protein
MMGWFARLFGSNNIPQFVPETILPPGIVPLSEAPRPAQANVELPAYRVPDNAHEQFDAKLQEARTLLERYAVNEAFSFFTSEHCAPDFQRAAQLLTLWKKACAKNAWGLIRGVHLLQDIHIADGGATSSAITPDSRYVICGDHHGSIHILDVTTGEKTSHAGGAKPIIYIEVSPDGRLVLTSDGDALRVWELANGKLLYTKLITSTHLSLFALTEKQVLYTEDSPNESKIRVLDSNTGEFLHTLSGHEGRISCISATPDGRLAISGDIKGRLQVWDLFTGESPSTFQSKADDMITRASVSADGRLAAFVVSGQISVGDTDVFLWDLDGGKCPNPNRWYGGRKMDIQTTTLTVAATGRHVLCNVGKSIRAWGLAKRRKVMGDPKKGHEFIHGTIRDFGEKLHPINSIVLSADNCSALISNQHNLQLLDFTVSGDDLTVYFPDNKLDRVLTSPDESFAVTLTTSGNLQLWRLDRELILLQVVGWDEKAYPILEAFLACRTPWVKAGIFPWSKKFLARRGYPTWTQEDFKLLMQTLRSSGYGWLSPDGIHRQLVEMVKNWRRLYLTSKKSNLPS